ncbi:uncharacterized protein [Apostichopus japonicus]
MNGRERQNNILPRLRVFNVTLSRDHRGKYGFKFQNTIQASVGKVQPGGPADLVGVKEGDTFLELDGFNVAGASSELISAVLKQSTGYVTALLQRTAEGKSPVPNASQTKRKPRPMSNPNLFYRTSTGGRKYIFSPGLSSPMQRVSLSCRRKLDKNRGCVKVSPYSPLLHRRLQRELAAKVAARQSQMQTKLESTDTNGADSRSPTGEEKSSRVETVVDGYNDEERSRCQDIPRGASHGQSDEEGVLNNHMTCQEMFGNQEVSSESRQSETDMTDEQIHDREDSSDGKVCLGVPFIPVTTARPDLESEGATQESAQSKASSTEVLQSESILVAGRTDTLDAETSHQQHHHHRHPLGRLQNDTEATKELLTTDQANNSFECEVDERKCPMEEEESERDQGKVSEKRHSQEDDEPTVISAPVRSQLPQVLQTSLLAITASDSPNNNTNASPLISDRGGKADRTRSNVRREYPKQGTVSFVDGVKPFLMSTTGREYVHVDRLLVQREGKRLQKLVVLLLTDVIVFGKLSTSGHFKVIYDPLHLDDISWLDSNCRKASEFRILLLSSKHPLASSRGSSINLVAPSPKCKRVWIRHLQQQLMIVKYQGLKKCMAERNLIPMESSEKQSQDKSKKTEKTRNEDRCMAAKYSACAMESNNNSNSESNHYSRLLSELSGDEEDMPSPKCNGPAGLTDRKGLALAHLDVEGAEKWSEGLRMPSSSTQGSKTHRGGSPIDGEDVSSNGDDRPNSYPHTSFSSPVNHSHSNSLQLVQSTQSTPTVSHRESFKRAKSAPSISPNSPMSCLVVKHPEKKLVRRQSSPPGALKENNSLSIGSKFRKTIFRRFTGNHREENNVQSSVAREVNKKDAKKTKRGFHSFSSSPQLNIRLSDTNSSSLQRIPHEEMMMNDVETRSLQDQPTRKTKSIAKEIKAKVQFLRRRHTEGSLQETEENVNPNTKNGPDLEDIRRWAEGFETLLKDEFGLEAFRKFLQTEFSDENIEFWLACEDYKDLKPSKMVARAHKIYEDYVTIQAPREVNLDSRTRLQVVSNLSHPNKHSFEQAQKRIEALMEKDSYPRFLRSDIYIKMQKAAKKNK